MRIPKSATAVLDGLRGKVEGAEVFESRIERLQVRFKANELDSVKSAEERGRALRVIKGGKLGYVTSTDPESGPLIEQALESARLGEPIALNFPGPQRYMKVSCRDRRVEELSANRLIKRGQEAVEKLLAYDPSLKVEVGISRGYEELTLLNTAGLEHRDRRTLLSAFVMAERVREGDIFVVSASDRARDSKRVDPSAMADSLIERLRWGERIASVQTKAMPVVFMPHGWVVLLLPLMVGLNGRSVYMGTSPLKGRLGEQLFDARLSLWDDGTLAWGGRSAPCDDEGVAARRIALIEKGALKGFLYDLKTATQAGAASTGHGLKEGFIGAGERDFRRPPAIAPTNWMIAPGDQPLSKMLAELDEVLLIDEVMGLGGGNILAGVFSNTVSVGFLVRKGEIVGRLKNIMISGNVYELLKGRVRALGDKCEWAYGIYQAPAVCLEGVSVAAQ